MSSTSEDDDRRSHRSQQDQVGSRSVGSEYTSNSDENTNTNDDSTRRSSSDRSNSTTLSNENERRNSFHDLVETGQEQQEQILRLQKELNQLKVEHKEGIYWLQLQLDTTRREKDAIEERMAELQEDLKDLSSLSPDLNTGNSNQVGKTGMEKQKYETAVGTLEHQIDMIKTSYGEINRSLKEEICDLMEDRTKIELDLLNQLSALDNTMRQTQLDLSVKLSKKDDQINRLKRQRNKATRSPPKSNADDNKDRRIQSLEEENRRLHELIKRMEGTIERERLEADEIINELKDQKTELEEKVEATEKDLKVALISNNERQSTNIETSDYIELQTKQINATLARVTDMKESADNTIQSLEHIMDKIQIDEDDEKYEDKDRMLSIIESAALLNGQITVSLRLIEVQLRNHVEQIKNENSMDSSNAITDDGISERLKAINDEALFALEQVEIGLIQNMIELRDGALEQNQQLATTLSERDSSLIELQSRNAELEAEVSLLRRRSGSADGVPSSQSSSNEIMNAAVLNQLQNEVVRIVQIIQEKNIEINGLKEDLVTRVKREETLRKELKRAIRAKVTKDGGNNDEATSPRSQRQGMTNRNRSNSEDFQIHPMNDFSAPFTTPTQVKRTKQPRRKSASDALSELPMPITSTPTSTIKPLRPSPREVFKSKLSYQHSPLIAKTLAFSPTKSPTAVNAFSMEG